MAYCVSPGCIMECYVMGKNVMRSAEFGNARIRTILFLFTFRKPGVYICRVQCSVMIGPGGVPRIGVKEVFAGVFPPEIQLLFAGCVSSLLS